MVEEEKGFLREEERPLSPVGRKSYSKGVRGHTQGHTQLGKSSIAEI